MARPPRRLGLVVLLLVLTAACGGRQGDDGAADVNPVRGGTLRILSAAPVDSADTHSAYTAPAWALMRLHVRTLYSWRGDVPATDGQQPVPDLAAGPPTISDDRRTYTFTLRDNVRYGPPVKRPVVATDFVYAVERQLDSQYPAPHSYNNVIKGTREFGEGRANTISGMKAVDDTTLRITLVQPAPDFLRIVSLPFFAPVPKEYASRFKPGTDYSKAPPVGTGPYQLEEWTPNKSAAYVRNENWVSSTDPLRKAYVDRVEVRMGLDPAAIQQRLEAGAADLSLDAAPPPADLPRLTNDPELAKRFIAPLSGCVSYLSLQTDNGPTAKAQGSPGDQLCGGQGSDRPSRRRQARRRPGDHGAPTDLVRLPAIRPVPDAG